MFIIDDPSNVKLTVYEKKLNQQQQKFTHLFLHAAIINFPNCINQNLKQKNKSINPAFTKC